MKITHNRINRCIIERYHYYSDLKKTFNISKHKAKYLCKLIDKRLNILNIEALDNNDYSDDIVNIEKAIENLMDMKIIDNDEFDRKYISVLEKDIGNDETYDEFISWLKDSEDYGIISSFCESDRYHDLRWFYENEEISIETVNKHIRREHND